MVLKRAVKEAIGSSFIIFSIRYIEETVEKYNRLFISHTQTNLEFFCFFLSYVVYINLVFMLYRFAFFNIVYVNICHVCVRTRSDKPYLLKT